jgi:hypothetical protein
MSDWTGQAGRYRVRRSPHMLGTNLWITLDRPAAPCG